MRVTVLIENTAEARSGLACEHGLSFLIESGGKKILLDAGSSEAFYENASALGLSLEDLDACALSHGHYDHSGGFCAIFRNFRNISVYAQEGADRAFFSGSGKMRKISVPKDVLAEKSRFTFHKGLVRLFDGVFLVPHHSDGLEQIGAHAKLYRKENGAYVPDDFSHEQSLVFDLPKGLVIFNSCSHGGAANIIREAKEACGGRQVYAYVGGLHMKGKKNGEEVCAFSDQELDALCEAIRNEHVAHVYTGHCTGLIGIKKLKERLGDTVHALTTGLSFTL